MTHYVSKPALERRRHSKIQLLIAACGAVEPSPCTTIPRRVECPACRRAMTSEERNP